MAEHQLKRTLTLEIPIEDAFVFFADAGNLERITPPELNFRITTSRPIKIEMGALIDYKLQLRGFPITWKTEISQWDPPYAFIDQALKSPYKQWIHLHTFKETESGGTVISDKVLYRLPFEPFGDLMDWYVRSELDYIFDYRQKTVMEILGG